MDNDNLHKKTKGQRGSATNIMIPVTGESKIGYKSSKGIVLEPHYLYFILPKK